MRPVPGLAKGRSFPIIIAYQLAHFTSACQEAKRVFVEVGHGVIE
jgi:hypothetical protein